MANNNYIAQSGQGPEWMKEQNNVQAQHANDWAKMLQMMNMSNKMTDQQMIGFALGKLLKDGWLNYKNKRDDKEKLKADGVTPNIINTEATAPITDNTGITTVNDGMKQVFGDYNPNQYDLGPYRELASIDYYGPANGESYKEQVISESVPSLNEWNKMMKARLGL